MPPETDIHLDIAAYLLGGLTPRERERYEAHLRVCGRCRSEADELSSTVDGFDAAREVRDVTVPRGLEQRVIAAVGAAVKESDAKSGGRTDHLARGGGSRHASERGWGRRLLPRVVGRPLVVAGVVAAIALAALAVVQFGRDDSEPGLPGELEVAGTMTAPSGVGRGEISVREIGIGRVISFESNQLPILPMGEYYEVWFAAPGDSLENPRRISAGTFHPDEDGRSQVDLTAAVDPALFPVLSVSAEPGDGDPARTGPEVLRLDSRRQAEAP